ncbi:1,4-dihydroxy-2-naphthoate octaprenyltransferase, putative [Ixodes scapularis]|uniref:1,4-dihydroxy-2-naphthoate octaprenyltransferase, putative n=1 Tax=Ixodes scapularis TaxID=6945 RepID=B7PQK4_IXOSC|nr:1,4-dihydroxy-2-naphthoate octaprenyltransferase, putative [Ixodes scapularis]|eukprot:XP_002436046.1 1,4-dihydroxy-2-naphthoate octaprenyltransferase, putative [Ixodes scapularis]
MARSNHHADGLPATRTRSLAEDGLCETPLRNNSVPSPQVRTRNSSRLSAYLLALRPWSFSASFAPVALGAALAYKVSHEFSPLVFVTTCVTALSVHAAGNVVNTYFDYMRGVDDSKRSDDRILVDKILTPDEVVHLGVLLYTVGCAGFILLVSCSPARMEHLALVYFGGLSSSSCTRGASASSTSHLRTCCARDVRARVRALLICGQACLMAPVTLFYAMPLAMNTEAILHGNNARDREHDARAGAVTLAVLLGHTGSHVLYALLLFAPYIVFAVVGTHCGAHWLLLPLITLPTAFDLERQFRDGRLTRLSRHTAKLNVYFGLFYILGVVMSVPDSLPGLKVR